ncbi:MAG: molybdopterin-dependent oxidoreductase [Verrucomicrobia bacterium]|nr:molybdopterin-dependent oxidoreductase [Verrucomicrobiota bacterium]
MLASKPITITIDGKSCAGTEGQTLLQIAAADNVLIPTLCYLKHLSPWGGCRMCIVELNGGPKVVPACSTPAEDGMTIATQNDRLTRLRRMTLELLFSERNHVCPMCPMNCGDCELQTQALRHGMDSVRFPYLYPSLPVDLSGRYFGLDHNRCILCTRCVRTCEEMEGVHTLDIANRGGRNQVVVDLNSTFGASTSCTLCGACVAACPTGALFDKAQAFRGKLNACRSVRTTCLECPVGCGLLVFTKDDRVVEVFGSFESSVSAGHLCVKGRYQTWADPRRRILTPLIRRNGKLITVSWPQALDELGRAAKGLPPEQTGLLASPRLMNEAITWLKRFYRAAVFVAPDEISLCRAGDKSPQAFQHLQAADAIIVLGAQPARENGVVAAKIRTTVRRRGAKLMIFHTRKSDLDAYADLCANVVSLEHRFWEKVEAQLADVKRSVLVYGPAAMTPIGVTVLEKLIAIFESKGEGQGPALVGLPVTANSFSLVAAGLEPLEDVAPWLDEKPLKLLHILASDEPDGGARLLDHKQARRLLKEIDRVVVSAAYQSDLTEYAQVVLPAAAWWEKNGTVTNFEGADLRLEPVLPPRGEARDDLAILEALWTATQSTASGAHGSSELPAAQPVGSIPSNRSNQA